MLNKLRDVLITLFVSTNVPNVNLNVVIVDVSMFLMIVCSLVVGICVDFTAGTVFETSHSSKDYLKYDADTERSPNSHPSQ